MKLGIPLQGIARFKRDCGGNLPPEAPSEQTVDTRVCVGVRSIGYVFCVCYKEGSALGRISANMLFCIGFQAVVILACVDFAFSAAFGYGLENGPARWGTLRDEWRLCDIGHKQSPVNLDFKETSYDSTLEPLELSWKQDDKAKLTNNGNVPVVNMSPGSHTLKGGPLKDTYELVQYHVHFADERALGAEHGINGHYFHAEIHFVHWNTKYATFAESVSKPDGLAVVGVLFSLNNTGSDNNVEKQLAFHDINAVDVVGASKAVVVDIPKLAQKLDLSRYFTYSGSLTTPPCSESVTWLVVADPIFISKKVMENFCSLKNADGGYQHRPGNYRPMQPLQGRQISTV